MWRTSEANAAARCPCGVCGRGVGSNSIQCISCPKWVYKKCSGILAVLLHVTRAVGVSQTLRHGQEMELRNFCSSFAPPTFGRAAIFFVNVRGGVLAVGDS